MNSLLTDSISRFRAELDQIECEIRRFERLYEMHRRHTTTTRDRSRGMTAEHAFELRGTLFILRQESSGHATPRP
jgi:hypothetical protein